ncbi:MAG: hypothetical protein K2Q14_05310 [Gammaproteobacteria bacterium]|nr:hypothetical protein [Gammaproteobacteria bacterium]
MAWPKSFFASLRNKNPTNVPFNNNIIVHTPTDAAPYNSNISNYSVNAATGVAEPQKSKITKALKGLGYYGSMAVFFGLQVSNFECNKKAALNTDFLNSLMALAAMFGVEVEAAWLAGIMGIIANFSINWAAWVAFWEGGLHEMKEAFKHASAKERALLFYIIVGGAVAALSITGNQYAGLVATNNLGVAINGSIAGLSGLTSAPAHMIYFHKIFIWMRLTPEQKKAYRAIENLYFVLIEKNPTQQCEFLLKLLDEARIAALAKPNSNVLVKLIHKLQYILGDSSIKNVDKLAEFHSFLYSDKKGEELTIPELVLINELEIKVAGIKIESKLKSKKYDVIDIVTALLAVVTVATPLYSMFATVYVPLNEFLITHTNIEDVWRKFVAGSVSSLETLLGGGPKYAMYYFSTNKAAKALLRLDSNALWAFNGNNIMVGPENTVSLPPLPNVVNNNNIINDNDEMPDEIQLIETPHVRQETLNQRSCCSNMGSMLLSFMLKLLWFLILAAFFLLLVTTILSGNCSQDATKDLLCAKESLNGEKCTNTSYGFLETVFLNISMYLGAGLVNTFAEMIQGIKPVNWANKRTSGFSAGENDLGGGVNKFRKKAEIAFSSTPDGKDIGAGLTLIYKATTHANEGEPNNKKKSASFSDCFARFSCKEPPIVRNIAKNNALIELINNADNSLVLKGA